MLKSAVIYGANASGKSNLLAALGHMRWLVLNSSKESQAGEPIDVRPFKLDANSVKEPSRFEVVFRIDDTNYRYGFEADAKHVCSEWLFKVRGKAEAPLFLREKDVIEVHSGFQEGVNLEDKTRSNALFLSVVAQFNGRVSEIVLREFRSIYSMHGLKEISYPNNSVNMLEDREWHDLLVSAMRSADTGIEGLRVSEQPRDPHASRLVNIHLYQTPETPQLREKTIPNQRFKDGVLQEYWLSSQHGMYSDGQRIGITHLDFEMEESEGTKKFFYMIGPILDCLQDGRIVLIDEIDAKMHPLLTRHLVNFFNSNETNPKNAQLIFCTHDTSLLRHGKFRRDQIWFTEKNQCEATDLYSLAEFKGVRKDTSLDKDYIQGRYGAIPFLGDFRGLLSFTHGEE